MDTEPSEWSEACDIWLNPLPDIYHLLVLIYLQSNVQHFISKIKSKYGKRKICKYWICDSVGFLHIKENLKASFDQFDSYSFTSFFLSASPISKMWI